MRKGDMEDNGTVYFFHPVCSVKNLNNFEFFINLKF